MSKTGKAWVMYEPGKMGIEEFPYPTVQKDGIVIRVDGATIDQMDISICIGDVTVVNFFHKKKGSCVTEEDVQCLTIKPRMLFVFGWSRYYGTDTYQSDWPYFSVDAVRFLT